jgi:hypothetical protein
VCILSCVASAAGQELCFLRGTTRPRDGGERDRNGAIELRYDLGRHLAWSFAYVNEGNPTGHRRDGLAAQAWVAVRTPGGRASLSLGAGPYRTFDTIQGEGRDTFDEHGWAGLYSVSAAFLVGRGVDLRVTASRVDAAGRSDTDLVELGVGFRLGPPPTAVTRTEAAGRTGEGSSPGRVELMPFLGRTRVNTLGAPKGFAKGLEVRVSPSPHVDVALGWLEEGRTQVTRRHGVTAQLWLHDAFLADRLVLGAGAGAYGFHDRDWTPSAGGRRYGFAALVSMGVGVNLSPRLCARFDWSRISTRYNRDADVFVVGLGIRPGRTRT